jgi:hypothetical protein
MLLNLPDASGTVSFIQDLSATRSLLIVTQPSTIHVGGVPEGVYRNGQHIGTWDGTLFTLLVDINDTVAIEAENCIFDGNGYTILGQG